MYPVPASIPVGCSAASPDVTAQLNAWIAQVPDGSSASDPSILEFPSGTCYHTEGSLRIGDPNPSQPFDNTGRNNLTFTTDGSSSAPVTFQSFNDTNDNNFRGHFLLFLGSNIVFNHVAIVGSNTAYQENGAYANESGWFVWGTQGVKILNSLSTNVYGDAVTLSNNNNNANNQYASSNCWTTNDVIENDTFSGMGQQGISLEGAAGVIIADDTITDSPAAIVDMEPNSQTDFVTPCRFYPTYTFEGQQYPMYTYGGINNVYIEDNTLGPAGAGPTISNEGAAALENNVNVVGNIDPFGTFSVWVRGFDQTNGIRTNISISDNRGSGGGAGPRGNFEITNVSGLTLNGNQDSDSGQGASENPVPVYLWGVAGAAVSDNAINNSGDNSIYPDVQAGNYGTYPFLIVDHPSQYGYPAVPFGSSSNISECGDTWGPNLVLSDGAC